MFSEKNAICIRIRSLIITLVYPQKMEQQMRGTSPKGVGRYVCGTKLAHSVLFLNILNLWSFFYYPDVYVST